MNVLVSGSAGFIGWRVVEALLQDGHHVVGVDDLNQAYDVRLKEWRLSQILERVGFRFYRLNVVDRAAVDVMFHEHAFDAVINLAARAGVRPSLEDPWTYYETNVLGTLNLLASCRTHRVPKFVLASTSSLYAGGSLPFREDQMTDRPLSPYAASKKAAEVLGYTYAHQYGLDVTVFRYFTVYGPAGRPDMSLFRFVQWISEERPVVVYGDGNQVRDFTYVDDVARGTLAALRPTGYEVINLGSNQPVKLMDAMHFIEDLVGKKARVEHRPAHSADMRATHADITKAKRLLNWEPKTKLEQGLGALVAWYQSNRAWAKSVATTDPL